MPRTVGARGIFHAVVDRPSKIASFLCRVAPSGSGTATLKLPPISQTVEKPKPIGEPWNSLTREAHLHQPREMPISRYASLRSWLRGMH